MVSIPIEDGFPGGALPLGLGYREPAAAGVDPERLEGALAVIAGEIERGRLPGAVAVVLREGAVIAHRAMGWAQFNPESARRPMRPDTLFDLASLTKVLVTLPLVLRLLERGLCRLDDRLQDFFPEFTGAGKEEVRIRHLLTHTAGLEPWLPLEREEGSRAERIARVMKAPLAGVPGQRVVYSDLSFILLGELVTRLTGQPLDYCAREQVFAPLGLGDACFNPPPEMQERCAATEYREYLGRHQVGEVHDERATALGGVAGHAGLFATAAEVAACGQMWLREGAPPRILSAATIAAATREQTPGMEESRGLGWMVLRPGATVMSCGDLFTPGSFGHTGFTGTSLWVDPQRRVVVALLTNNVHFGRTDVAIRLRPRFHNAVIAAID